MKISIITQQHYMVNLEEEDAEAIVERSERYHLRRRVLNQLTLRSKFSLYS